ncbi:MAG: hypothetical protein V3W04_12360 [Gammaproteobacteria bacterium]
MSPAPPVHSAAENEQNIPVIQRVIAVLWPSFVVAAIANGIFFTLFDPEDLLSTAGEVTISRMGVYTIGFFLFWLVTSISSTLTCYFRKPCTQVNVHK